MNPIGDDRAEMAAKLVAAGGNATTDPAAQVPCILVSGAEPDHPSGVGAWGFLTKVRILVPPPGDAAAMAALEEGLVLVLRTLGFARGTLTTYRMSTGGQDVPCYELSYPRDIPNPDC